MCTSLQWYYLNPDVPWDELPGDDDEVVTVTTEDDLEELDVLCTSTSRPFLYGFLPYGQIMGPQ